MKWIFAIFLLSGMVPDKGYTIVDGKIIPIPGSELIVTQDGNSVQVSAK